VATTTLLSWLGRDFEAAPSLQAYHRLRTHADKSRRGCRDKELTGAARSALP